MNISTRHASLFSSAPRSGTVQQAGYGDAEQAV
jgi:hypothetical protein